MTSDSTIDATIPPITAIASGCSIWEPAPQPSASGIMPATVASAVIMILGISCGDEFLARSTERPALALDAMVGALTAMMFLPITPATLIGTFLVFRILDLMRPLSIPELAKLPGGAGLMLPAFAAGVLANLAVQLLIVFPLLAR